MIMGVGTGAQMTLAPSPFKDSNKVLLSCSFVDLLGYFEDA